MIIDRIFYTLARRWLLFFNLALAIYVGLPMLAPVLMNAGLTGPANIIYRAYSPMCHQLASRSFFLFGEQPAYPRAIAGSVNPTSSKNSATRSAESPSLMVSTIGPPSPAASKSVCARCNSGISNRQGAHQVAQKLRMTGRPW